MCGLRDSGQIADHINTECWAEFSSTLRRIYTEHIIVFLHTLGEFRLEHMVLCMIFSAGLV